MNPGFAKNLVWFITAIQLCTSIAYFIQRDFRHGLYWLLIVMINITVTV